MLLPWRDIRLRLAGGREVVVPTSLTDHEAAMLAALADDGVCLEVGSAYGYSAIVIAESAKSLHAIDPHRELNSFARMRANLEAAGVAGRVRISRATNREVLPELLDSTYDLVFIDGNHARPDITFDLAHGWRLLKPGGHLAVHDYGEDTCPDVRPAVESFRDTMYPADTRIVDTLWVATRA